MDIDYTALCEMGLRRRSNQDKVTAHTGDTVSIFAVADGMGGHSDGEYASNAIISSIDALWSVLGNYSGDLQGAVDMVISALEDANENIYGYAASQKIICGSTAAVLLLYNGFYAVINVGDSPIYYADAHKIRHLSTEHNYGTIMQKSRPMFKAGSDKKREKRLVSAVGIKERLLPSVVTGRISGSCAFYLCSDGISRYFSHKYIMKRLKRLAAGRITHSELSEYFRRNTLKKGAADNFSSVAVAIIFDKNKNDVLPAKLLWILAALAVILAAWIIINILILEPRILL